VLRSCDPCEAYCAEVIVLRENADRPGVRRGFAILEALVYNLLLSRWNNNVVALELP